jgi:hypothetical protein
MLKFLRNCKALITFLMRANIEYSEEGVLHVQSPHTTVAVDTSLFLVGSSKKEAEQIAKLKNLYGEQWPTIYKALKAKERLEKSYVLEDNKCL